jgi:hypothetical protein
LEDIQANEKVDEEELKKQIKEEEENRLKINEKQKELDYFSKLLNVDTNNQQVPL